MSVHIEVVVEATAELVDGLNELLPQLSKSASPLTTTRVEELVASPATTVATGLPSPWTMTPHVDVKSQVDAVCVPSPSGSSASV